VVGNIRGESFSFWLSVNTREFIVFKNNAVQNQNTLSYHVEQQEDTIRNLMLLGEILIMGNKQL
jgi:hypothetical protein